MILNLIFRVFVITIVSTISIRTLKAKQPANIKPVKAIFLDLFKLFDTLNP